MERCGHLVSSLHCEHATENTEQERCALDSRLVGNEDGRETLRQEEGEPGGRGQMDSPKALTMQYMVLFSHRTVQLPAGQTAPRSARWGHLTLTSPNTQGVTSLWYINKEG